MNLRDFHHSAPGFKSVQRKRIKDYGHENPVNAGNIMLSIAAIVVVGLCLMAAFMAFPEFANQQIERGRELAAIAMGVVK